MDIIRLELDKRHRIGYKWAFAYALAFAVIGFALSGPKEILEGIIEIMVANDILITDYFALVGMGPTFVNVSLVTLITVAIMYFNSVPLNGAGVLTLGLMTGFSFFGKNLFNMWFIFLGTLLYSWMNNERFAKYTLTALLSTSLGPLISTLFFYGGRVTMENVVASVIIGIIIGFIMPLLAAHTDKLLHGMSLYNGGFAIGLIALVIVPVLKSYGFEFESVLKWSTGHNTEIALTIYSICILLVFGGYTVDKEHAFENYSNILKRPGISAHDFTVLDGMGAVLINMGVNGMIATTYILLIGGDLNGPTICGIITVIGFGAKGKHAKNITPVLIGVALGGLTKQWRPDDPAAQIAALFGTTLAPFSGTYGVFAGIAAGFLHSSVSSQAGLGYSGVNLYNNGFAGGIVSLVLYPVMMRFGTPNTYSDPSPSMVMKNLVGIARTAIEEEKA